ncbi:MAG: alpha/beta hydrolase fold domain-containing protein [Salinisphaera sp.]|nr:alpha/beta hydrolase fold domain-containing protein [Salinisphaera sp.]
MTQQTDTATPDQVDAVVIGCGFAGIYALHKLRDKMGLSVVGIEAASGPGGTWWWNRYPGARCDIESVHYAYSFSEEIQREWNWSERYGSQPENLRYLEFAADKLDVRRSFLFDTRVTSGHWDDKTRRWTVDTNDGQRIAARFVVACSGFLSVGKSLDEFPGVADFDGELYSSSSWPHEPVDFAGKRVGVIGTGASGMQIIPEVAKQCGHLTVFQRTPNYGVPGRNRDVAPEEQRRLAERSVELRAKSRLRGLGIPYDLPEPSALAVTAQQRRSRYDELWAKGGFELLTSSYADLLVDRQANETLAQYIREKIRGRVDDPELAEKLCPYDHPYAAKRPPLETGYYEAFNRDNVELVDVRAAPIEQITATGIRTSDAEYPLDMIILAVGFDGCTGPLKKLGFVGRDGATLKDAFTDYAKTYFGIATAGFPNLFTVLGPTAAAIYYNNPLAIEDHVELAADAIQTTLDAGAETFEADEAAEQAWKKLTDDILNSTLVPQAESSWYMGANIPGKPQSTWVWPAPAPLYRAMVADSVARGYAGFRIGGQPAQPAPPMVELDAKVAFIVGMMIEQEAKPLEACSVEEARAAIEGFAAMQTPAPDTVDVTETTYPGPAGDRALRIYRPKDAQGPLPVVVFYHGGGFIAGSIDLCAAPCANLAEALQAVVITPSYRLAPEAPFPAATDDTYAALCWAAENAAEYGGDPDRLIVMGESAGGTLAAVAAQRARDDENGPELAAQVLLYPTISADADTESRKRYAAGPVLGTDAAVGMWQAYLGGDMAQAASPLACPNRAQSLEGLPPALVLSVQCDPLRDEGEDYARAMQAAGVPVELQRIDGLVHGAYNMSAIVPRVAQFNTAVAEFVRQLPEFARAVA